MIILQNCGPFSRVECTAKYNNGRLVPVSGLDSLKSIISLCNANMQHCGTYRHKYDVMFIAEYRATYESRATRSCRSSTPPSLSSSLNTLCIPFRHVPPTPVSPTPSLHTGVLRDFIKVLYTLPTFHLPPPPSPTLTHIQTNIHAC